MSGKVLTDTPKELKAQNEIDKKLNLDPVKIFWEELSLIMQEYFQALDRFRQDPLNPVKHQIY